MVRFTADVDSPPAKQTAPLIKQEKQDSISPGTQKPVRRRRWLKKAATMDDKNLSGRSLPTSSHSRTPFIMVRFTADVDSPPAKQTAPVIKQEKQDSSSPVTQKPVRRRRWYKKAATMDDKNLSGRSLPTFINLKREKSESAIIPVKYPPPPTIRKFSVEKLRPPTTNNSRPGKTFTRCSLEVTLLITIALALGYFVIRDVWPTTTCNQQLSKSFQRDLVADLSEKIFRQEIAIHNLTTLLATHSGLTTMSFIGACGTGKSFTARVMANHFKAEHAHAHTWPADQQDHLQDVAAIQQLILDLPPCQPEILIVDNLGWTQKPYVEDLLRWSKSDSRLHEKNLVVVFIFNLERFGEEPRGGEDDEDIKIGELQKTHLVNFKRFQDSDAMDYLVQLRERDKGGIHFDVEQLEMIVDNVNVRQYGLKRLANKFQTVV